MIEITGLKGRMRGRALFGRVRFNQAQQKFLAAVSID